MTRFDWEPVTRRLESIFESVTQRVRRRFPDILDGTLHQVNPSISECYHITAMFAFVRNAEDEELLSLTLFVVRANVARLPRHRGASAGERDDYIKFRIEDDTGEEFMTLEAVFLPGNEESATPAYGAAVDRYVDQVDQALTDNLGIIVDRLAIMRRLASREGESG